MDDDARLSQLQDKLDELIELSEENNEILRAMQRSARWSFWGKLLIWIIVLVLPFIVLGPLLKTLVPGLPAGSKGVFGLPSETQIQDLLKAYQEGSGSSSDAAGQ